MNISHIKSMVEKDCMIDETRLDHESLKLPQLHNKYMNLLMDAKMLLEKVQNEYYQLRKLKWEYYTGKMPEEVLNRLGWEPFDLKILRQDMAIYMDGDDDLIMVQQKICYYKEMCQYLDATVKEISFRHNKIRNAIDWKKFLAGA